MGISELREIRCQHVLASRRLNGYLRLTFAEVFIWKSQRVGSFLRSVPTNLCLLIHSNLIVSKSLGIYPKLFVEKRWEFSFFYCMLLEVALLWKNREQLIKSHSQTVL